VTYGKKAGLRAPGTKLSVNPWLVELAPAGLAFSDVAASLAAAIT